VTIDESWLRSATSDEEAATLTAALVAHRSLPGEEAAVQAEVARWLEGAGLPVEVVPVAPERPNVMATIPNGEGPTLLLNGHTDTAIIDPRWDPERLWGKQEGDRLYGLGAADMKSGVAAAMLAIRALAARRDLWRGTVIFASVVDEEAFSIGARALIESGIRADYCVVTEASWDRPALGSFGKLLIRIDVTGAAAHASMPEKGINAATEASRLAARLSEVPVGSHPRIHANQCLLSLHAGPTDYQSITVPDSATLLLNWHTVPGEQDEDVVARIRELIGSLQSPARFDISIDPPYYPAWETPVDAQIVQAFIPAYQAEAGKSPTFGYLGYGDMNLFSVDAGMSVVMVGPRGDNFHAADEWVEIPSIGKTVRVLLRMATALLPA
jgi:succinyl-diaminopimelate desuccinylase